MDKAIAVALDGFLRMPAALRKSRRGGRKGRSELYFRLKRFLDSEVVRSWHQSRKRGKIR